MPPVQASIQQVALWTFSSTYYSIDDDLILWSDPAGDSWRIIFFDLAADLLEDQAQLMFQDAFPERDEDAMMYIETATRELFEKFARQMKKQFAAFAEKIPYYFYALSVRNILVEVTDFSGFNPTIQQATPQIMKIIGEIDSYFADNVAISAELRQAMDQNAVVIAANWKNICATFPAGTPFE